VNPKLSQGRWWRAVDRRECGHFPAGCRTFLRRQIHAVCITEKEFEGFLKWARRIEGWEIEPVLIEPYPALTYERYTRWYLKEDDDE
jgi:hypothetical protein